MSLHFGKKHDSKCHLKVKLKEFEMSPDKCFEKSMNSSYPLKSKILNVTSNAKAVTTILVTVYRTVQILSNNNFVVVTRFGNFADS